MAWRCQEKTDKFIMVKRAGNNGGGLAGQPGAGESPVRIPVRSRIFLPFVQAKVLGPGRGNPQLSGRVARVTRITAAEVAWVREVGPSGRECRAWALTRTAPSSKMNWQFAE